MLRSGLPASGAPLLRAGGAAFTSCPSAALACLASAALAALAALAARATGVVLACGAACALPCASCGRPPRACGSAAAGGSAGRCGVDVRVSLAGDKSHRGNEAKADEVGGGQDKGRLSKAHGTKVALSLQRQRFCRVGWLRPSRRSGDLSRLGGEVLGRLDDSDRTSDSLALTMALKKKSQKPTPRPPSPSAKASSSASEAPPFTSQDASEALRHFQAEAEALPEVEVDVCRADVQLVLINVLTGIKAIEKRQEEIRQKLPLSPLREILELPALALALVHAASKIIEPASKGEIGEKLAELRPVREMTLKQLEIFAGLRLVDDGVVRGIRKGSGLIDSAEDAVRIAEVFRNHEATFAGKHPFTREQIDQLALTGTWLLQHLRKGNAPLKAVESNLEARLRDRLWVLVQRRHEHLREAGVPLFGLKNLDAHIPPLQSRVSGRPGPVAPGPLPA